MALVGIGVSLVMMMMVRHVLFAKEYSLGLGMLVAASTWIWPSGQVDTSQGYRGRWRLKRPNTP